MKNWIILALLAIALFSCRKEAAPGCIGEMLTDNNLTPYTGQDIGCNFYLDLYDLDGEQYFAFGSHCVDMVIIPFNCEGDTLCMDQSPACTYFWGNMVNVGIIGFQE